MEKKPFSLGLVVGRFQTLHKGHEDVIGRALAVCGRVGILIGSAQECGTEKNPFSYATREKMLKAVYGDAVGICPLADIGVGNNAAWGAYVLQTAQDCFGALPDLFVSGREERRVSWFDGVPGLAELYIPKTVTVSASALREALLRDDRAVWERYTSEALMPLYGELREQMMAAFPHKETASL